MSWLGLTGVQLTRLALLPASSSMGRYAVGQALRISCRSWTYPLDLPSGDCPTDMAQACRDDMHLHPDLEPRPLLILCT